MPRTIADLIHDYLAPIQPDDCRQASLGLLANALKASGPVVHRGKVVSSKIDGYDYVIDFDASRPVAKIPASIHTDEHGVETEIPAREPTDDELAKAWGLKAASGLPLNVATEEHAATA